MDFFGTIEKSATPKDAAKAAVKKHTTAMDFFGTIEKEKSPAVKDAAKAAKHPHAATDFFDIFALEKSAAWSPFAMVLADKEYADSSGDTSEEFPEFGGVSY